MDTPLNFIPIDREIRLDPQQMMFCKFDTEGTLEYVNEYFSEFTGYEAHEIVGLKVEKLKHPELPLTVFNYLMGQLSKGENVHILMKDQIKDGRYYWYLTDFEFKAYQEDGKTAFISKRTSPDRDAIPFYDNLYQKLIKIEQHSGLILAQAYFDGFLEENQRYFNTKKSIPSQNISKTSLVITRANKPPQKRKFLGNWFK